VERRRWLAFDVSREYLAASAFRFIDPDVPASTMKEVYADMLRGETIDATRFVRQGAFLENHEAVKA
jgi:site-specific DNA-methyltransferase (cytosine-N4-specific)